MDRRYLSDRVPQFDLHPEDEATFIEKIEAILPRDMGPYGGFHPKDIATVLAALLCESLGLPVSSMRPLVTRRGRTGLQRNPQILDEGGCRAINKMVRRVLHDHLALADTIEVKDQATLNRIGGLVASALDAYIGKVVEYLRWERDIAARIEVLTRYLNWMETVGGRLIHIEDDYLVAEFRGEGITAQVDIFP